MRKSIIAIIASLFLFTSASAQTDKAVADQLVYDMLTTMNVTENWHPGMVIRQSQLKETAEKGIYMVRGESFQVNSMRSDFYVKKEKGEWVPINDSRYPVETMVNLLQNRITDNQHQLKLRHHQYGGKIPTIVLPMQNLFDLFARHMDLYCSVTYIDENEIRATLVFHQRRLNYIHMLTLTANTNELTDAASTFSAEFYTNIPQGNVNDIFKEKNNKKQ
ncbi:MAG: hypothetical protein K5893_04155 [Prevotella sp.]|jgi:hypothetical protein|nr:hypothetical protein [Prevotella sp.]